MKNNLRKILIENDENTIGFLAYHGTKTKINKFSNEFVNKDNVDEMGPGIYFTTDFDDAAGYGNYVYTARFRGHLITKDKDVTYISRDIITDICKSAEEWELEAQNYSEDPISGLEMYIEEEFYNCEDAVDLLQQIWYSFFRYDPLTYVRKCVEHGIDGIVVPPYGGHSTFEGKHIILYNPSIINVTDIETT